MVDWQAIQKDYEQGLSQRSLALKYGVNQSSISRQAAKEQWCIIPRITPTSERITDAMLPVELSDLSTVEKAMKLIAERLDEKPDNKDIKMLMDSLSQAHKIKLLLPQDDGEQSADSLRSFLAQCSNEELAIVRPIIAAVHQRKQEQEEKVKPIRRIG